EDEAEPDVVRRARRDRRRARLDLSAGPAAGPLPRPAAPPRGAANEESVGRVSARPEDAVAGVAESRDDVAVAVEAAVDRRRPAAHVGMRGGERGDPLG